MPEIFVPYTGLHGLAVAVCALLIVAPAVLGRALQQDREVLLRRLLAALAVAYWIAYNTWWNWHGLDWRTGLPLQLCDVNGLIAPFALLTARRFARATLYFWTAALTLQAFIQPALTLGPASLVFWAFWIGHTLIAACAVYDVAVRGFRPNWGDLGRALIVSAVYVAIVVPINHWLGADYGFIGNPAAESEVPPFILMLGPWPQRAIILLAMAAVGFTIVLLPWRIPSVRAARVSAASRDSANVKAS